MGLPWRASPSWSVVERAEATLERPLAPLLLDADADLSRTQEAQIAVFLTSLMAWDAVTATVAPVAPRPIAFAGHSLGQVTALVASGALSLKAGVRLAWERASCTQEAADRRPGRMAAVIGLSVEATTNACQTTPRECWIANDNANGQVVIGGTAQGVETASERCRQSGARKVIPLNVGGAFHTPLMTEAGEALRPIVDGVRFQAPSAPIVSNLDATAYADADGWPERLVGHLVAPVQWRRSMETMATAGAAAFLEVGPGDGVLSGMARRTVPDVSTHRVASPGDIQSLSSLLEVA